MKPQLVYVDQDNAGTSNVPAGHIGLSPDGYRHHRNYYTAPLIAAPFIAAWFAFTTHQNITTQVGMGTMFICFLWALLALAVVGAVAALVYQKMERSLVVKDVAWFALDTLGLTEDQRIDFALDIEVAQQLRSPELQQRVCGKLQEIHEHATWLTEHQDASGSEEFQTRQRSILDAMDEISGDIQQEVVII